MLSEPRYYAQIYARPFYALSDPNMTPTLDTKDPRESIVLTIDATSNLADAETLTSASPVTVTLQQGVLPDTPVVLSGAAINAVTLSVVVDGSPIIVAVGKAVQVVATAGSNGATYLLALTCPTSNPDKTLELKVLIPVSDI